MLLVYRLKVKVNFKHIEERRHIIDIENYSKGCEQLEEFVNYLVMSRRALYEIENRINEIIRNNEVVRKIIESIEISSYTANEWQLPSFLIKIIRQICRCEKQNSRRKCVVCIIQCNKILTLILDKIKEDEYVLVTFFPSPHELCNIYI